MVFQPRLGPARITSESFANQAFRTTAERLHRLPAQWRGAVVFRRVDTVENALERMGDGRLDPHGTFLAFSGREF